MFDGSTDDTAAWVACYNILKATNGGTFRTAGGYAFSCIKSGLVIDGTGMGGFNLVGAGRFQDALVSACGADVTPITIQNCSGCSVQNFMTFGKGLSTDATFGASHPALAISNAPSILLRDVWAYYGSLPISVNGTSNCIISDVHATQSYGPANLYLVNADGCNIYDNGFDDQSPLGVAPLPASMSNVPAAWQAGHAYGANFTATICNTACNGAGTQMHVTAVASGNLAINEEVTGTSVASKTQIFCQLTGSAGTCTTFTGGTGYYKVSASNNITVGESMQSIGDLVATQGYYIQLTSPGTSGGSAPTLKNYLASITDGTATWELDSPVGKTLLECDSGCNENTFNNHDATAAGGATYDIWFNDSLSTGGPTDNVITGVTLGGTPYSTMLYAQFGARLAVTDIHTNNPALAPQAALVFGSSWGGNARIIGNSYRDTIGAAGDGLFIDFGGGVANVATGNTISGGTGVFITGGVSNATINNNEFIGATTCLSLSGTTDSIDFSHNDCGAATVSNSASGTHNVIRDNRGYNPVGVASAIWATGSTSNYTAGPSPETHYLTGGTVTSVKVGTQQVCATTPCFVDLGPNETINVTYSGAPTDVKSVH